MILSLLGRRGLKRFYHELPREPHGQTRAAYLLLIARLQQSDPDYLARRVTALRVWRNFRNRFLSRARRAGRGRLSCHYCGNRVLANFHLPVEWNMKATLDHVRPLAKGGRKFALDNLVVACYPCNHRKADKYEDTPKG